MRFTSQFTRRIAIRDACDDSETWGDARRPKFGVRLPSPTTPAMPTAPAVAPPDLLRRRSRRRSLADHDTIGRYRRRGGNAQQPRNRNAGGEGNHSQCHCTLLFARWSKPGDGPEVIEPPMDVRRFSFSMEAVKTALARDQIAEILAKIMRKLK
jgi:hypothetical protein